MNSATIKKNRERLLDFYSNITYHQVLEHFNTDIEHLGQVLIKRRNVAVLKSIFINNRTTTAPDSICWYCKHATNAYGQCSWSAELKPRSDWTEDSYEKSENGIRVKSCPGFEVGTEYSLDRKTVEIILADAFEDPEGFISRKYFTKLDNDIFLEWLDIYNEFLDMAHLPPMKARLKVLDDPDEE